MLVCPASFPRSSLLPRRRLAPGSAAPSWREAACFPPAADQFPFTGTGGPTQESLRIFALDDLYNGVVNPPLEFGPLTDAAGFQYFAMRPAITHGSSDVEFVVSADPRPLLFGTQGTYMT